MTEPRFNPQFNPDCTKTETILGCIWLVVHMFALPCCCLCCKQKSSPK